MITKVKNTIEITHGEYWTCLEGTRIPIGVEFIKTYQDFEEQIEFIQNPRIKVYILIKMIYGMELEEAINRIFDKAHLFDSDYRNLIY